MAEIRPFKALRFDTEKAGNISELVCPPYDIISEEQRQQYIAKNPHNIIRLELPKGDDPYGEASRVLDDWLEKGILRQDEKEAVYIYEEEFTVNGETKKFKGCIVRVKLEEFSKGIVLPHEETLSKAKEDRFNLMKATNCNFSQIYSLYMDEQHEITSRLDKLSSGAPVNELTDSDNVTHRLWTATDKDEIDAVCKAFADKKLYIADGHHRYETALNYRNYCRENNIGDENRDYVMMMLVDMEHPGLVVLPTHRLVRDLPSFDKEKLLKGCEEYFDITKQCLFGLNAGWNPDLIEAWFLLHLMRAMGEEMNLYRDNMGNKLIEGQNYTFDFTASAFAVDDRGEFGTNKIKMLRLLATAKLSVVVKVKIEDLMFQNILDLVRVVARV